MSSTSTMQEQKDKKTASNGTISSANNLNNPIKTAPINSFSTNNNKKKKKRNSSSSNLNTLHRDRAPPTIPLSPEGKPNENSRIELEFKKIELKNEKWEENTLNKSDFLNSSISLDQIAEFGLNTKKSEYGSCINLVGLTKKKIKEFTDDGQSIHVVQQFKEIGCPLSVNQSIKKGCWCIAEIKKQKDELKKKNDLLLKKKYLSNNAALHQYQQQSQTFINPLLGNNSIFTFNPILSNNYRRLGLLNNNGINSANMNIINIMNSHHHNTTNQSMSAIAQQQILANARNNPQIFNSTKMQQLRTQQLLNQKHLKLNNAQIITTKINALNNTINNTKRHKDTIIFTSTNQNNEPPLKKRKKSRWK